MLRFTQYLQETQNESHPHFTGSSSPDKSGTITHTYTDEDLGVRTRLFTHPSMKGSAYWGFETRDKNGNWSQEHKPGPSGRLRSAMSHVAHFAQQHGVGNITYQTMEGSDNHALFQRKWPEYHPDAAKKVRLTQVESNPLKHITK